MIRECPEFGRLCDMAEVRGLTVALVADTHGLREIQLRRQGKPQWRQPLAGDGVEGAAKRLLERVNA